MTWHDSGLMEWQNDNTWHSVMGAYRYMGHLDVT